MWCIFSMFYTSGARFWGEDPWKENRNNFKWHSSREQLLKSVKMAWEKAVEFWVSKQIFVPCSSTWTWIWDAEKKTPKLNTHFLNNSDLLKNHQLSLTFTIFVSLFCGVFFLVIFIEVKLTYNIMWGFFFKILFWSSLYTQHKAQTHNPKIKRRMLHRASQVPLWVCFFFFP